MSAISKSVLTIHVQALLLLLPAESISIRVVLNIAALVHVRSHDIV